jgi:leader peptidase (prepilin peptidase)/N-methyltransferase
MLFFSIASINLGFKNSFEALILAFSTGAIICLILILSKKLNIKERVPFIPFLSLGIYLSIFLNFSYL